ncbi:MAG: DUF1707 domain-containing protein [Chloroflexota bacterium]
MGRHACDKAWDRGTWHAEAAGTSVLDRVQEQPREIPRTTRAGNDDRQRVADQLQAHYVDGRLSSSELEERLEQTMAAQTFADLDRVLADLPELPTASEPAEYPTRRQQRAERRRARHAGGEQSFRAHATSYLLVMALLVGIWLVTTPGGYFWPIWPMLGWGIGLASHGLAARREQGGFSGQTSTM